MQPIIRNIGSLKKNKTKSRFDFYIFICISYHAGALLNLNKILGKENN